MLCVNNALKMDFKSHWQTKNGVINGVCVEIINVISVFLVDYDNITSKCLQMATLHGIPTFLTCKTRFRNRDTLDIETESMTH